MTDRENFMSRWSRRKQEAAEEQTKARLLRSPPPCAEGLGVRVENSATRTTPLPSPHPQGGREHTATTDTSFTQTRSAASPHSDLAHLPPIDSITAASDIRPFLAPGVPAELTRAALRRVWSADPGIRDFVGLSENSWDFNAPDSMPGFGPLEMTDALRQQIAYLVDRTTACSTVEKSALPPPLTNDAKTVTEAPAASHTTPTPVVPGEMSERRSLHEPTGPAFGRPDDRLHDVGDSQMPLSEDPAEEKAGIPRLRSHGSALPR
jgi:hypothetical protein